MEFEAAKCPCCGGNIHVPENSEKTFCSFCGAQIMTKAAIAFAQVEIVGSVEVKGISSADKLYNDAQTMVKIQDWEKADDLCSKMIDAFPADWRGWHERAMLLGRYKSSLNFSDTSTMLAKDNLLIEQHYENFHRKIARPVEKDGRSETDMEKAILLKGDPTIKEEYNMLWDEYLSKASKKAAVFKDAIGQGLSTYSYRGGQSESIIDNGYDDLPKYIKKYLSSGVSEIPRSGDFVHRVAFYDFLCWMKDQYGVVFKDYTYDSNADYRSHYIVYVGGNVLALYNPYGDRQGDYNSPRPWIYFAESSSTLIKQDLENKYDSMCKSMLDDKGLCHICGGKKNMFGKCEKCK